jgi:hypothetical protein
MKRLRLIGRKSWFWACLSALLTLTVPNAESFSYPLSPEQVREAYFLGETTDDQKVVTFLDLYIHRLPYPKKGPYVESVEFRSPYEQVVLRSRQHLNNYSAADAQRDYDGNPKLVLLRILIFATPSYTGPTPPTKQSGVWRWTYEDFVKGFQFAIAQERTLEPQKVTVGPACPPPNQCEPFSGVEVLLQFEAEQFTPGIANIQIRTPDGQEVRTEFNLDALK